MKATINLLRLGFFLKIIWILIIIAGYSQGVWLDGARELWARGQGENASLSNETVLGQHLSVDQLEVNQRIKTILKARIRALEQREERLSQRERDLALWKEEILQRIDELKRLEESLKGPVSKAKKESEGRFRHLVGVYSSMDPQRAAMLLERMEEDTVVRLFSSMKSKKVAKILSFMDAEKAARLSSRLSNTNTSN